MLELRSTRFIMSQKKHDEMSMFGVTAFPRLMHVKPSGAKELP